MTSRLVLLTALLATPFATGDEAIFTKDSKWETVTEGHQFAEGMAFDQDGHFYFTDVPKSLLYRIDRESGEKTVLDEETGRANGIAFGPDGQLYGCSSGDKKIYAWDPKTWKKSVIATGTASNDIAIRDDRTVYYTDPQSSSVWRVSPELTRNNAAALTWRPNGIALSLDQKTLFVAQFASDTIHAFPVAEDGSLGASSPGFVLQVPADEEGKLDGMMIHHDGRVISGTALGVQIVPRLESKSAEQAPIVIPIPGDRPRANYVRMSPDKKWLYVAFAQDILRRQLDPAFAQAP